MNRRRFLALVASSIAGWILRPVIPIAKPLAYEVGKIMGIRILIQAHTDSQVEMVANPEKDYDIQEGHFEVEGGLWNWIGEEMPDEKLLNIFDEGTDYMYFHPNGWHRLKFDSFEEEE